MTDTTPFITAGGLIIVALVTVFGSISVALINRTRQHALATREQTENDHSSNPTPNLRVNIDDNQLKLMEKLDVISDTQRRQSNKIDRLFSITNRQNDRLEFLEDTQTRAQITQIVKEKQNDQ